MGFLDWLQESLLQLLRSQNLRISGRAEGRSCVIRLVTADSEKLIRISGRTRVCHGPSLNDLLTESPLPADRAARYIEQVARAVDEVHRHGILHGDIKPQNILIDSEAGCPLIADFGLAELNERDGNDAHSEVRGTPSVMPPELARAALAREPNDEVALGNLQI